MAERSQRRVELADGRATTVHVVAHDLSAVAIDHRDNLPRDPGRALLQAGPLLGRDGRGALADVEDPEASWPPPTSSTSVTAVVLE